MATFPVGLANSFVQQTPATTAIIQSALGMRRGSSNGTKRRKGTKKKRAARAAPARRASGSRKSKPARLVKGSAAAKAYMAKIRRKRK